MTRHGCVRCGRMLYPVSGSAHMSDRADGSDWLGSGQVCRVAYHHVVVVIPAGVARAVDRFDATRPTTYRAHGVPGAPVRDSRYAAQSDWLAAQVSA